MRKNIRFRKRKIYFWVTDYWLWQKSRELLITFLTTVIRINEIIKYKDQDFLEKRDLEFERVLNFIKY
jgi:hypothetical protein